jgi:hypothetical protein
MNIFDPKYIDLIDSVIDYKLKLVVEDKNATMFYQNLKMKLINKSDFTVDEYNKIREGMIHYSKTLKDEAQVTSTKIVTNQLSDYIITELENKNNKGR